MLFCSVFARSSNERWTPAYNRILEGETNLFAVERSRKSAVLQVRHSPFTRKNRGHLKRVKKNMYFEKARNKIEKFAARKLLD